MKLPQIIKTKLEVVPREEIPAILDAKIEEYKEKNLPIEQGLADYIAKGMQNIDDEIEKLKNYKKLIDEQIKEFQVRKSEISEEIANYLENNLGVDKLKGLEVSSITIKPESESKRKKLVYDIDKKILEKKLVELGFAHYEEEIKIAPKQVKINKRRKNGGENTKYLSKAE